MNSNFPSRLSAHLAALVFGISLTALNAGERFHLEPLMPSQSPSFAAAAPSVSGGNVANYPNAAGSIPKDSSSQFFLAESSFGYCGPTSEGGVSTRTELNSAASSVLAAGTFYKTTGVPGNWQIVFPGVVDVATGGQAPGTQNFNATQVQAAVDYFRAVALAYPNDLQAKINFINAVRDLMVPYTYAGNNAFARATKERIINGPNDVPSVPGEEQGNPTATDREDATLQNASGMYEIAISTFVEMTGIGDNLAAAFPSVLPPGVTEASQIAIQLRDSQRSLCSAFARSMGYKGETLLRSYQLKYFKGYAAPTLSAPVPMGSLISAINQDVQNMDYRLLSSSVLESNPWFPSAEFAPARSFAGNLRDLRNAVQEASLTFTGLDASLSIKSNAYGPEYIPFFFDPGILSNPTTFKGLIDFAKPLALSSVDSDTIANGSIGQLDTNLQSFAQRQNEINDQFNSQLGQLCGYKTETINGVPTLVPDIDGAILPPEQRPGWKNRVIAEQGEIGLQWLEIDAAEQGMEKALLDLENVIKLIDQKTATWQLIKDSRQDMIQNVILATGEKVDQLNKDTIEAKTKFAEYQARLAKKKKKRGLFGAIFQSLPSIITNVAAIVSAPYTGGASLLALAQNAVDLVGNNVVDLALTAGGIADAYSGAGAAIKELRTQADLERRLGEINAKKEELAYLEKAGMQFQQIEEDGYRTEEAVSALMLEAKSAELQIEMAELRVDREYTKLSTMLNRVSYLMQQHAASYSLVNTNPLNSPDFRIIRDRAVREAEERFLFAQEWAFLTGRAASYVALGSTRRNNIDSINSEIRKARTGRRLNYLLDRLQAEMNFVTIDLGARTQSIPTVVSLRDYIYQHNNVIRTANGEIDATFNFPWEAQSITTNGVTAAGATQTFSDDAWKAFLRANTSLDPVTRIASLKLPFRLTFNRWADLDSPSNIVDPNDFFSYFDRLENPLFTATQYGSVIFYSDTKPEAFGVRIDILGANITGIGSGGTTVTATLSPEGASYVRQRGYTADPNGLQNLVFQFGRDKRAATIQASVNGTPANLRNPQLHERSPANDRWVLTISNDTQSNRNLLNQLDKIRDIRVSFALSSYAEQ